MKKIFIHKQAGVKKDAVRVNKASDIPEFLKNIIDITEDAIYLDCVGGRKKVPIGSVIGYEKSEKNQSGWDCWCIGDADTSLVEVDGVFYKKVTIMPAMIISDEVPDFLNGADIMHNSDGSWLIRTDCGVSFGRPGEAYWVKYGEKVDGTPDADILAKNERSYKEYIVCDEYGTDIGFLSDIDPV